MKKLIIAIVFMSLPCFTYCQDYEYTEMLESGNYKVTTKNGNEGLLDSSRKLIIKPDYYAVSDVVHGLVKVVKDFKVGFVNLKNEQVIPFIFEYDTLWDSDRQVEIAVQQAGTSPPYAIIISSGHNRDVNFYSGLCVVKKNGKYGYINVKGEEIIPFIFEAANTFRNGVAIVKKNGKFGVIDGDQKTIIPFNYDDMILFNYDNGNPWYCVIKDNHLYYIDSNEKEVDVDAIINKM